MALVTFNEYWEAMTAVEAQEMLLSFQIASWPMFKKETRSRVHKDIQKLANPKLSDVAKEPVNMENIVAKLTGAKVKPRGS